MDKRDLSQLIWCGRWMVLLWGKCCSSTVRLQNLQYECLIKRSLGATALYREPRGLNQPLLRPLPRCRCQKCIIYLALFCIYTKLIYIDSCRRREGFIRFHSARAQNICCLFWNTVPAAEFRPNLDTHSHLLKEVKECGEIQDRKGMGLRIKEWRRNLNKDAWILKLSREQAYCLPSET